MYYRKYLFRNYLQIKVNLYLHDFNDMEIFLYFTFPFYISPLMRHDSFPWTQMDTEKIR